MNKTLLVLLAIAVMFNFVGAKEAMMIKAPGSFNPAEYTQEQQAKFSWLVGEAAPLTPESAISIMVDERDIDLLEEEKCETCGDIDRSREKVRVGLVRPVNASFGSFKAVDASDGGKVWTMAVSAKGATALRLHITDFNLPEGAGLYIYNSKGTAFGPYTNLGPNQDGEFWTNTVYGSLAYLQIHYNGSNPAAIDCTVANVGYLGSKFLIPFMQNPRKIDDAVSITEDHCSYNENCVEDASCYGTSTYPGINDHKYAAAHMLWVSGVWMYMCSGGLLNNTSNDLTPYFLTANHCISKDRDATSLECYFQYWTASCHGACYDPVGVCPRTLGAGLVKGSSKESDFTLLLLSEAPPSGSVFLGWTTAPIAYNDGTAIYRLSHPSGAPQAFSKHIVDSDFVECRSWPVGKWIYSYDVIGATEGGSSGSPVCNASGQVVGQLSGGCGYNVNEVCDTENNRTVDGAFANYYSLISQWLDPS
jgi:hypothetical protein